MSEFRKDVISGQWVIIAPERAARPTDFPVERRRKGAGFCPFCEGNEDKTPREVFSLRDNGSSPDGPGWRVRVVPNRYPALSARTPPEGRSEAFSESMGGFGFHEVIIDTARHVQSLSEMTPAECSDMLLACCERLRAMGTDSRLAYAMLFKNTGASAGATVEHSHTQLIGMPVTPTVVRAELARCAEFATANRGDCLFCRVMESERAAGERVMRETPHFLALAPYAARFPFEMWVLPKAHSARFEELSAGARDGLAGLLCGLLKRLDEALERPAYNLLLHTAPLGCGTAAVYHWHIEVIPCIARVAGFEWGTGFHINPVTPESAAEVMRKE